MSARMNFSSIASRNESSICRPGTNSVRTSVFSTAAVFCSTAFQLVESLGEEAHSDFGFASPA